MSLTNKIGNLFLLGFMLVGLVLPATLVAAANNAPIIGSIADKEVQVGKTLEFSIVVKDPDGDQIVSLINAGKTPEGVSITKVTNNQYKFSWTPIAGQEGKSYTFGLRATDAQGANSATESFTVKVLAADVPPEEPAVNHAPVISPVEDKEVTVGETLEFQIVVTDVDGDAITALVNAGQTPAGVSITQTNPYSFKFSWTPVTGQEKEYTFGLRATDSKGANSNTEYFKVKVSAAEEKTEKYSLADYPEMFITNGAFNGNIVVGEKAGSQDSLSAADIVASFTKKSIKFSNSFTKLDSEISKIETQNLIVIGSPCANAVAAELLGNPASCTDGFTPGKAKIKLFEYTNGKVALLVAGYSDADTRLAAKVLANYEMFQLEGMEVTVEGTSLEDVKISGPESSCPVVAKQDPLTATLQEGEEKSYCFNGKKYLTKLTFVDEDEAKFNINGADTAKLKIGAEETLADSKAKIKVKELLYQAYAGGLHAATFTLSEVTAIADKDKDGVEDSKDNCPDNANADQKDTDGDKLGDVCDQGTTPPADNTNTEDDAETAYKDLNSKFNGYEDDFSYFKKKYEKAVKAEDKSDISKYEKKLKNLDNDLDDLEDDINDLIDDLEEDEDKNENVLGDLDDLNDEVTKLQEKISDALNGKTESTDYSAADNYIAPTTASKSAEESKVEVKSLDVSSLTGAATAQPEVKEIDWSQVRYTALLIAGIVVLLAVVLFLLAVLFR